jgi:hypothetical protein
MLTYSTAIHSALYDGRVVDAYFTLAFYKHLLGIPVGLSDLESVDPDVSAIVPPDFQAHADAILHYVASSFFEVDVGQ